MCCFQGVSFLKRGPDLLFPFLSPPAWNTDVMAEVLAAIFYHENKCQTLGMMDGRANRKLVIFRLLVHKKIKSGMLKSLSFWLDRIYSS